MQLAQLYQSAVKHFQAGQLREAESLYGLMLNMAPVEPGWLIRLGVLGFELGKKSQAIEYVRRAISMQPNDAQAHYHLGTMLAYIDAKQAIACFQQALKLQPQHANALADLGCTLLINGDPQQAVTFVQRALDLNHCHPRNYLVLANALREVAQLDRAIAMGREALARHPNWDDARLSIAMSLLLQGDLENGWPDYEDVWETRVSRKYQGLPKWDGSPLPGHRILLHCEHGFGDMVQLIRYAPSVAARGLKVILYCPPPLCRLLAGMKGIDQVVSTEQPLPQFDVHVSLMSLPRIFRSTLTTLPPAPYLDVPAAQRELWRQRISQQGPGLKVGLAWAASKAFLENCFRSLHLSDFAPLADAGQLQFFSLQIGPAATEVSAPPNGMKLVDWTADVRDFADTAALIANLDLVISCDTAVVHVAGALGKRVWVVLPHAPSCLWLLNRSDSPWYSSARLFRQQKAHSWKDPIDEIQAELRKVTQV